MRVRGVWLAPALVVAAVVATVAVCGAAAPAPEHGWSQALPGDGALAVDGAPSADTVAAAPGSGSAAAPSTGTAATAGDGSASSVGAAPAAGATTARVSRSWSAAVAARTGIPERAVRSYAGAALAVQRDDAGCHLGWTTLAGLGAIESGHGTHGGSAVAEDGTARPAIFGPQLGDGTRAMGPLQFIPSTWSRWGADGNGDGVADPQNLDDAALAAAHYLCSYGDLAAAGNWRTAIFAYNHLDSYVAAVLERADAYAAAAR
jgi:membrane-bound lytic murein transglycosylase B